MDTQLVALAAWLSLLVPAAMADETHAEDDEFIEEIIVWGRAETQKGHARSASQGLVGFADFSTRPLQRVAELVEVVPGMVATQHSGEGKANQYYLRGMNLDHGTDFSAFFEGMPINMRAHAHGQGYLDLNFLIPEIVSTVHYAKGPYAAERGDFSTAGTTDLSVYDRLDAPFVEATVGSDHFRRAVAAGSFDVGDGHVLSAVEVTRSDGPWQLAADVDKLNAIVKYAGHWHDYDTKVIVMHYDNEWNSTDQVPARLVDTGQLDRFGFIDPTLGGSSSRASLIAGMEDDTSSFGGFASYYTLNLIGNFTYFLEDPLNGDQHEQVDRRWIYGGHARHTLDLSERIALTVGGDARYDDIADANLYATTAGVRRSATRKDSIEWLSLGAYAELEMAWTERLRATIGLRTDYYDFEVDALNPLNSGDGDETQFTPNVGLAYAANDHIELYLNWGRGFHSNDVRGRTINVDPISGDPVAPVELFVDQQGAEIGARLEGWRGLAATLTYFWLESDSELLFGGDSGSTEPSDGSQRTGIELNVFWNIDHRWTLDLIASFVDSEFTGVAEGFDHIPNAHGRVIGAGVTYAEPEGWTASLRLRHFGEAPLVEDDTVQRGSTSIVNAALAYDFGQLEVGLELINVFDAEDDDIAYFFESRLPGESTGVEDVHFHPVDAFSVRASFKWML